MNSIDDVISRIQQIATRIQDIQNGNFKVGHVSEGRSVSGGTGASAASTGASAADVARFQEMLNQAISIGSVANADNSSPTGDSSDLLSRTLDSLTGTGGLGSLLGSGTSALGTSTSDASAAQLTRYQQMLIQAIQELSVQNAESQAAQGQAETGSDTAPQG